MTWLPAFWLMPAPAVDSSGAEKVEVQDVARRMAR